MLNQLTLHNISNVKNNLCNPELRAALSSITDEQRGKALLFKQNTKELDEVPDGCGFQAFANIRNLLDYLSKIELNLGGGANK